MSSVVGKIADANHYSVGTNPSGIKLSGDTDCVAEYKCGPICPVEGAFVGQ